jgi:hypothetical protein
MSEGQGNLFRYPRQMETFDLDQTAKLAALAPTPPPERDQAWCDSVLHAAPNASLASFNPRIQNGPDTFPYFQLAIPGAGPFTPFSIVHLLDHLLQAGAGVVIHANLRRDQQPLGFQFRRHSGVLAVPGFQGRSKSLLG